MINIEIDCAANGNITSRTDIGSYVYDQADAGPHAVTDITTPAGPFAPAANQTVVYSGFNKASLISQNGYSCFISYGPDRQRRRMALDHQGADNLVLSKYYVFGDFERETDANGTRQLHYIAGGDGLAAIYVKYDTGADSMFYIMQDHLGSLVGAINAESERVYRQSFDAWGRARNPEDWSYNNIPDDFPSMRGYTGHEHLKWFGLINMNGRMYDAGLCRFLSPDPYVQMPDNSQNFNRYSYCFNNPLIYTDPSGEIVWFVPVIAGAAIGGFSGWQIGKAAGAEGWEMAGYIGGGALIGGLSGGAAAGISAAGGGAMLAGAGAGAVGGAGFSGLSTGWNGEAMLDGAIYGGISGFVGGGVGGVIGGGWGALAGGAAANLTSQLLYNGGDFNSVNWGSVGLSGATSLGIYHAISFSNWQWGGGKNFGDVELKYSAYNKLNATYTRSRTLGQERGGWITNDGKFVKFDGAEYSKFSINMDKVQAPANAKYLVHTHWSSENGVYWNKSEYVTTSPYEPSAYVDPNGNIGGDISSLAKYNVDGMILTNKSLLYFNQTHYSNQWNYPLLRYLPLYFW